MGVGAVKAASSALGVSATGAKAFGEAFAGVGVLLKTLADLAEANHYNNKSFQYLTRRCLAQRETTFGSAEQAAVYGCSEGAYSIIEGTRQ